MNVGEVSRTKENTIFPDTLASDVVDFEYGKNIMLLQPLPGYSAAL